jgi:hypothetical protein
MAKGLEDADTEETSSPDIEDLARQYLIFPIGTWKETWDLLILACIFSSAITVPVRSAFSVSAIPLTPMWYLEVSIALAFIVDVCFNFNTVSLSRALLPFHASPHT